jgi:cholesterol transport system auxiliary component
MKTTSFTVLPKGTLVLFLVTSALLLPACSGLSGSSGGPLTYDFGPPVAISNQPEAGASAARPTISVAEIATPEWLDSPQIFYRLAYADGQQPRPYAGSRWAMQPALLITQRLKSRLAEGANVVSAGDTLDGVLLKVDLDEFAQVFSSPSASQGLIQMRATVIRNGRLLGQRSFFVECPAATADAAGGVRALTRATDNAINDLATWALAKAST